MRTQFPKKNIEFINAALAGYTSFESYGRLWSRLRFYSPDLIIINHGWNEMYYFTENQVEDISKWRKLPDGDWTLDRQGEVLKIYEPLFIDKFLQYSQLLSRARMRLTRILSGYSGEKEWEMTELKNPTIIEEFYDKRGLKI